MGWETALLLAASAATAWNNDQTIKRQDQQAANAIQNQGRIQRQVDSRIDDEVRQMEQSTAADERAKALEGYMTTLGRNRRSLEAGLTPAIGSNAFRESSAAATGDVNTYAQRAADLMSRIDAPAMQRQGEAFGYGKLATDVGTLARNAQSQSFLDEMRLRAIRKNPLIDLAAGAASAYAGGQLGASKGAGSAMYTGNPNNPIYGRSDFAGGSSLLNGYGI